MTLSLLLAITSILIATIVLVSLLVFGREWFRAARAVRFSRRLGRHAAIVARLASASPEEFPDAFRRLAAVADPTLREAIIDAARDAAGPEAVPLLAGACDDLGMTDRYVAELLGSRSWEARAAAAEKLGRIGSARAVPALLKIVRNAKDEDEDVCGAALRALGRIRDPRALPDLVEALGYPDASLPPRIAEIILLFGEPAVAPMVAELRNLESDVRRTWAADILGWLGDRRASMPLVGVLGDVNPEVRAKAAGALGRLGEARAVDRLLEMLLSDPASFVRTRVAQALGAIGHPKVIDHLVHVLKDPEWWVRIRAIEALETIGKSSSGALLVALEDEDPEVRRRAATALERMGYVEDSIKRLGIEGFRADVSKVLLLIGKAGVCEVLLGSIMGETGVGQKLLVRIAGDIGNPAACPILRELLAKSKDPALRSRIVESLGKIRCSEAIPDLLSCLRDTDDWVRRAAVEALSVLEPGEHTDELARLLKDPVPATRQAVCRVIGRTDGERAADAVKELLADPSPDVRAEALRGIARTKRPGREQDIRPLLFDASDEVRLEAARALAAAGGPESVADILRAAGAATGRLVEALIEALCRCHAGPFADLLPMLPGGVSHGHVLVLLEVASRGTGEGRLAFVSSYLRSADARLRCAAVFAMRGFGEASGAALAEAMNDPDETVRAAAITAAGLVGGDVLIREAENHRDDPQEAVRFRVALALGLSGEERFEPALRALGADSVSLVRAAAAMALALRGGPPLLAALKAFVRDADLCAAAREIFLPGASDPLVARVVAEASRRSSLETRLFLGGSRFELEKEMAHRARTALAAEERARALEICEAVATGQSYTAALTILKNDPSPAVRIRALELVVKIRPAPEVAAIVGSVLLDPHPALRVRAAKVLGDLDFHEAVEALICSLDTPDRELREAVTSSLSRHLARDPKRAERLMREIQPTKTSKLGLVWLLGKTRREGVFDALVGHLEDADGDVRAAAVGALAKYPMEEAARHLGKSLSDPNGRVRAAAVNALSKASAAEWEKEIEKMLYDPDPYVCRRAAVGLLRMGSPSAEQRIRAMAEEPEVLHPVWAAGGVVRGIVRPTEALVISESETFLRELFPETEAESAVRESPDPATRLAAFRVLRALPGDAAARAATILLRDPDARVRGEAEEVLREPGGGTVPG